MKIHNLIILGAGPAGLTAATYAARAKLEPLLLEGPKPGGQLMGTSEVENWPGEMSIMGPQLMMNMIDQAKKHGTQFISESLASVDLASSPFRITTDQNNTYHAKSIIITTGSTPNKLNCPGEEKYWGKGVSTCSTCDAAFFKDKPVVVLGGGDAGMENASFLAKFTDKITLIHIGPELTASKSMQERVLNNKNISIIYNSTITEIIGNEEHVTHVTVEDQQTKATTQLETSALFLSIGQKPNTDFFKEYLACSEYGHLITHDYVKTSIEGVFAAGDVQDWKYRQAIVSSGFGCIAALEAERYLESLHQ